MTQDPFPPPESSNQKPQTPPESLSDSVPATPQPEPPIEITPEPIAPEPSLTELESPGESGVRNQESGVEESVTVEESSLLEDPPLSEAAVRNRESSETVSPSSQQSASETLQAAWERVRPGLQTQTVKALRGTIQLLEGVVERLEESGAPASEKRSENMPPTSETVPDKPVPPFLTAEWREKFRSTWQRVRQWWATVLPQIRERLPESLNARFSDRALTGAIATILVLFLWIVPGLFSSKPSPTPIAQTPPVQTVTPPAAKPTIPPQISASEPAKPVSPQPPAAKPAPKSVKISPAPSPLSPPPAPPPLKLTPEQTLIARIQDQVAEISNQYVNGLIQSVQANFRSSRLTVKVGNGWYGLSRPQQNKLADEMLGRTQELNFSKLEITDLEGTLLARSPVVGSEMIILKREQEG